MRRAALLLMVLLSLGAPRPAFADETLQPGEETLVDQTFRLMPGADLRECLSVSEMTYLTVVVSSPPGRTGESVAFNFSDNRQTVRPDVQVLMMDVPDGDVLSTHLAPAGSYCYYLAVTHNLTSSLPADAPEQPDKQIHLKIISTPYPR